MPSNRLVAILRLGLCLCPCVASSCAIEGDSSELDDAEAGTCSIFVETAAGCGPFTGECVEPTFTNPDGTCTRSEVHAYCLTASGGPGIQHCYAGTWGSCNAQDTDDARERCGLPTSDDFCADGSFVIGCQYGGDGIGLQWCQEDGTYAADCVACPGSLSAADLAMCRAPGTSGGGDDGGGGGGDGGGGDGGGGDGGGGGSDPCPGGCMQDGVCQPLQGYPECCSAYPNYARWTERVRGSDGTCSYNAGACDLYQPDAC
jgi:uncharacterized membrane protein YgcG